MARGAENVGLPRSLADDLAASWTELTPWPEAPAVLKAIARDRPVGGVTNCSEFLGEQAAAQVPINFATIVTAERAGAYKPRQAAYRLALDELGLPLLACSSWPDRDSISPALQGSVWTRGGLKGPT